MTFEELPVSATFVLDPKDLPKASWLELLRKVSTTKARPESMTCGYGWSREFPLKTEVIRVHDGPVYAE